MTLKLCNSISSKARLVIKDRILEEPGHFLPSDAAEQPADEGESSKKNSKSAYLKQAFINYGWRTAINPRKPVTQFVKSEAKMLKVKVVRGQAAGNVH